MPPGGPGWGIPQAPKPGIIPLRPLGVGEILDGAFAVVRRYPAATLGLSAAVMLVVESFQLLATYLLLRGATINTSPISPGSVNGDFVARAFTADILITILTVFATVLLSGMLTAVIGPAVLGRRVSPGDAWQEATAVIWRLFGTVALVFLITAGIVLAGVLPGLVLIVAGAAAGGGALQGLGVVLAVLGGIAAAIGALYVGNSLSFATPVVMLEKQRPLAALARSRALVKNSWWRVFGITLLGGIIASVVASIIGLPFSIASGVSTIFSGQPASPYRFSALLLSGIGALLGSILVRPFSAGVSTLLYIDRRMRSEALDLTLQQASAGNPG
jgi:hypothetical protein